MFGRTFLRQIANSRRSPEHQWDFVKIVVSMFRGVHSPCVSRNEAVQQTYRTSNTAQYFSPHSLPTTFTVVQDDG